jgi:glycosyltransferase involved in cell wall biosynthesis
MAAALRSLIKMFHLLLIFKNPEDSITVNIVGDNAGWSLDEDAKILYDQLKQIPYNVLVNQEKIKGIVFCTNRYHALDILDRMFFKRIKVSFPYYHGYPDSGKILGGIDFDACYKMFSKVHHKISKVQVTHTKMKNYLLETGIDPDKLATIYIGVDTHLFHPVTQEERRLIREKLGIPQGAIVIGSFQKDGNGWEEGNEPKLIKGPDILLKTLRIVHQRIPNLFVLLTGPARGFIKKGLIKFRIPFIHYYLKDYHEISDYYSVLDAYIVSSRQEGGPKAILESMASGVPIITTKVGQAVELVDHGINGWLADIDNEEELAAYIVESLFLDSTRKMKLLCSARKVAEENDYIQQVPQWRDFFESIDRK